MSPAEPMARFGDLVATGLVDVTSDPRCLDTAGRWAVIVTFDGSPIFARFQHWQRGAPAVRPWPGISGPWRTSLDRDAYCDRVQRVRQHIAAGWVYQVNVCRVLSADTAATDLLGLGPRLEHGPIDVGGCLHLPDHGVHIASASPEVYLSRSGAALTSGPIKGTARTPDGLLAKDRAENIMIVDMVRNDLSKVATVGSVKVPSLLKVESYPGLHHLVSTVSASMPTDVGWSQILAATFPPGSVTGAPKSAAVRVITELEPVPREVYCGAFGWVDADRREARLAVAIRTFWLRDGRLHFGTGAGVTWGSDPLGEWRETQLKAERLIAQAGSGS